MAANNVSENLLKAIEIVRGPAEAARWRAFVRRQSNGTTLTALTRQENEQAGRRLGRGT